MLLVGSHDGGDRFLHAIGGFHAPIVGGLYIIRILGGCFNLRWPAVGILVMTDRNGPRLAGARYLVRVMFERGEF